ncbi:MAG: TRAP transporter substrate-binding protein [Desulfarculaceae bacterium]|nr:TRAP transporter substrate-binding protein [Desulfarculaceae bacterium]MCF8071965.1 TRAP transporter substrate-binding protein [Desulfarculaceae bacterium]MCF8101482.1 TRAP transporter substrate-binding protein [Desulfarculaceae bacterium]MCF8115032.1 TRAP transporter substrate-binding protein [Desulfarculaceae bacterium]
MKRAIVALMMAGLLAIALAGVASAKPIVIKLGHGSEAAMRIPGAGRTAGILAFANYVEAATNGEITFEIHPNSSLGGTRAMIEQCQTGVIQMAGVYTSIMVPFAPEVAITQIPYLFKSNQIAWKVMSGQVGDELAALVLKNTGLRVLLWPEGAGYRNLYTKGKMVKSPADLKGMKIRVPENPGLLAMFRGWGARTVTVTWKELYTALQTGMAKGCDTELYSMYYAKLYEVCPNITMSRHSYNLHPLLINEKFFQSLSKQHQKIILEASDLCRQVMNGYSYASEIAVVEVLKKKGAKFYYPTDAQLAQFKDLGQKPYMKITVRKIGDDGQKWVDKIFAAAKKAEQEMDQMVQDKMNMK